MTKKELRAVRARIAVAAVMINEAGILLKTRETTIDTTSLEGAIDPRTVSRLRDELRTAAAAVTTSAATADTICVKPVAIKREKLGGRTHWTANGATIAESA